jgi:hypothetical protein
VLLCALAGPGTGGLLLVHDFWRAWIED